MTIGRPRYPTRSWELTDQAALDRWADEQTGGLIDKFPLKITDETLLVLASALTARVRWRTPFEGYPRETGARRGRKIQAPPINSR